MVSSTTLRRTTAGGMLLGTYVIARNVLDVYEAMKEGDGHRLMRAAAETGAYVGMTATLGLAYWWAYRQDRPKQAEEPAIKL